MKSLTWAGVKNSLSDSICEVFCVLEKARMCPEMSWNFVVVKLWEPCIKKLLLSIGKRPRSRDQHLQVLAVLLEKLVLFNGLIILGTECCTQLYLLCLIMELCISVNVWWCRVQIYCTGVANV